MIKVTQNLWILEQKYEYNRNSRNISRNVNFWRLVGTNESILDLIRNGFNIPLISMPKPTACKNNKSVRTAADFVDSELLKLLSLKCMS